MKHQLVMMVAASAVSMIVAGCLIAAPPAQARKTVQPPPCQTNPNACR